MSTEPVRGTFGPFEQAYRRGVLAELGPPPQPASAGPRTPSRASAAPPEAVALRGAVLTPDGAWNDGYVVVDGGAIAAVQQTPPSGVRVLETGGVLLPGLVDLHGHPE